MNQHCHLHCLYAATPSQWDIDDATPIGNLNDNNRHQDDANRRRCVDTDRWISVSASSACDDGGGVYVIHMQRLEPTVIDDATDRQIDVISIVSIRHGNSGVVCAVEVVMSPVWSVCDDTNIEVVSSTSIGIVCTSAQVRPNLPVLMWHVPVFAG